MPALATARRAGPMTAKGDSTSVAAHPAGVPRLLTARRRPTIGRSDGRGSPFEDFTPVAEAGVPEGDPARP
jgi:hypothetical protein